MYNEGISHLREIDLPGHTAILLFARTPGAEAEHKALGSDHLASVRRLEALDEHIFGVARASGLPVIRFTESDQRGSSFGARLAHAVSTSFAGGYEHLIVVGTDCPELRKQDLWRAAYLLGEGKSVVGPDQRGGAFLIGLSRRSFAAAAFAELPWQTAHLASSLTRVLAEAVCLSSRQDINTLRELKSAWYRLRALMSMAIAAAPATVRRREVAFAKTTGGRLYGRRGPPVAA